MGKVSSALPRQYGFRKVESPHQGNHAVGYEKQPGTFFWRQMPINFRKDATNVGERRFFLNLANRSCAFNFLSASASVLFINSKIRLSSPSSSQ